jgi:hypothetical protein
MARVARFSMVHDTKTGKMYQINTKCTKWSQNIPNVRKIFQMEIKYFNIFHSKVRQIYPNWDFWFENKPSGNPGHGLNYHSLLPFSIIVVVVVPVP